MTEFTKRILYTMHDFMAQWMEVEISDAGWIRSLALSNTGLDAAYGRFAEIKRNHIHKAMQARSNTESTRYFHLSR